MASRTKPQGFKTLAALRGEAKQKLAAGDKSLKGYYKLSKTKLASKLGYSEDARNMTSAKNLKQRADNAAASVAGDSEGKRTVLKQRILRSVKREVDAARKANPDISQAELRKVAAGALGSELKAIKEGKAERNLRKEAAQKRKGEGKGEFKYSPPSGVKPDQIPPKNPGVYYLETADAGKKNAKHFAKAYGLPDDYYLPVGTSGVSNPGVAINPDYVSPRTERLQEEYSKVIKNFNETRFTRPARQRLEESQREDILAVRRGEKPGIQSPQASSKEVKGKTEKGKTKPSPSSVIREEMAAPAKTTNRPMTQKPPTISTDKDADRLYGNTMDAADKLKRLDKGNRFSSAIDRMDASPSYGKPTMGMMTDASGSGFVVTARDLKRIQGAYSSVPESQHGTLRQLEALGQYKLKQMWEGATPEMRKAAVQAHGKPDELEGMGFSLPATPVKAEVVTDTPKGKKPSLGDRLRETADSIRESDKQTARAASRIVGAAAQIARNQDNLITEVADMARADLDAAERKGRKRVGGSQSPKPKISTGKAYGTPSGNRFQRFEIQDSIGKETIDIRTREGRNGSQMSTAEAKQEAMRRFEEKRKSAKK